jgi:hypothetical protein
MKGPANRVSKGTTYGKYEASRRLKEGSNDVPVASIIPAARHGSPQPLSCNNHEVTAACAGLENPRLTP